MLTIRAMSDGKGYSARYLEQRDYYAEGERVLGRWQGCGAELLGVSGEVVGITRIRRIWASRVAAKSCVDRRRVHVVEFHRFLTIG